MFPHPKAFLALLASNAILVHAQTVCTVVTAPVALVASGTTLCCQYYVAQAGDTLETLIQLTANTNTNPSALLTLNPGLNTVTGLANTLLGLTTGEAYCIEAAGTVVTSVPTILPTLPTITLLPSLPSNTSATTGPTASCSPVAVNVIAPGSPTNCCQYYTAAQGDTVAVLIGLGLNLPVVLQLNPSLASVVSTLIPGDAYCINLGLGNSTIPTTSMANSTTSTSSPTSTGGNQTSSVRTTLPSTSTGITSSRGSNSTTSAPNTSASSNATSSTSGTLSSSTATTPSSSATAVSGYLIVNNNVGLKKRQSTVEFLTVNTDGTVSVTPSCADASVFSLNPDGTLTSGGLFAAATTAEIADGSSPLVFDVEDPANVETTFTAPGGILQWTNAAFAHSPALFGLATAPPFLVNVFYDGVVAAGFVAETFTFLDIGSPAAVAACAAPTSASGMTTSTAFTTVTYTITACPATVTNCPVGHVTTETIPVYTTVCPVETSSPATPAISIGVLVSVFIDITIQVGVNGETSYLTSTILSTENALYNTATAAQPCYPCEMSSQGMMCPTSGVTATQTICRSCPATTSMALSPVVQTCNTCAPVTVTMNLGSSAANNAAANNAAAPTVIQNGANQNTSGSMGGATSTLLQASGAIRVAECTLLAFVSTLIGAVFLI